MASRDPSPRGVDRLSRYLVFPRQQWAHLRGTTPLTLSQERLLSLRSLSDRLSLQEVEQVYLPLSRLLHLYVVAVQHLHAATATFLGHTRARTRIRAKCYHSEAVFSIPEQNPARKIRTTRLVTDSWDWMRSQQHEPEQFVSHYCRNLSVSFLVIEFRTYPGPGSKRP